MNSYQSQLPAIITQGQGMPYVTRDEVVQMVAATSNPKYRMLLRIMWALGARVSEVTGDSSAKPTPTPGMLGSDFFRRGQDYLIRIQVLKRKRPTWVEELMPFDLAIALEDYVRVLGIGPEDKLVNMDRRQAYQVIKSLGRKALDRDVHPHMLRHGSVYHDVQNKVHPYVISAKVRHANINSTLAYFHVDDKAVRDLRSESAI